MEMCFAVLCETTESILKCTVFCLWEYKRNCLCDLMVLCSPACMCVGSNRGSAVSLANQGIRVHAQSGQCLGTVQLH